MRAVGVVHRSRDSKEFIEQLICYPLCRPPIRREQLQIVRLDCYRSILERNLYPAARQITIGQGSLSISQNIPASCRNTERDAESLVGTSPEHLHVLTSED